MLQGRVRHGGGRAADPMQTMVTHMSVQELGKEAGPFPSEACAQRPTQGHSKAGFMGPVTLGSA